VQFFTAQRFLHKKWSFKLLAANVEEIREDKSLTTLLILATLFVIYSMASVTPQYFLFFKNFSLLFKRVFSSSNLSEQSIYAGRVRGVFTKRGVL
jgi:hypothetical protein